MWTNYTCGIKGKDISDTEFKISQFADDTSLPLPGGRNSFEILPTELDSFGKMSGLIFNYVKQYNAVSGSKQKKLR